MIVDILTKFNYRRKIYLTPEHPFCSYDDGFKMQYSSAVIMQAGLNKKVKLLNNFELERLMKYGLKMNSSDIAWALRNSKEYEMICEFVLENIKTGKELKSSDKPTYSDVFSEKICQLAKKDKSIVAVTAAMPDGTGLNKFSKWFPERFFDVGIAEEHAVTFSAGMAAGGLKPVVAVYSSFLQRAFDQTIHDVCLQNLPVMIAVDRAGLVGSDGETHQGLFDLSFLNMIPNMTILSPKNRWEMADMVRFCADFQYPVALRYPRGAAYEGLSAFRTPIVYGKSEILYEEEDIAVIFVGHMAELAVQVRDRLKEIGYHCSLINARFVKPLDTEMLEALTKDHRLFVTIEENVLSGGFGEQVLHYVSRAKLDVGVRCIGIPDDYVEHGNVDLLRREVGLDAETIVKQIIADYVTIGKD